MTARCALMSAMKIFGSLWLPTATFPDIFNGLFFRIPIDAMHMRTKFEVRSFTCSWDNRVWVYQQIWAVPEYAHAPFSKMFNGMNPVKLWMFRTNLRSVASPLPDRDNSDWSFGWGLWTCEPPVLERRGRMVGWGSYRSKECWSVPIGPSQTTITFPLSLRVSERLLLLCSSTPLFPTPPLVSSKFPHVPLGVGGLPLGYEERTCWANCLCS